MSARQAALEGQVRAIKDNMVSKADLSDFMKLFDQGLSNEEILILDGNLLKQMKPTRRYTEVPRAR